MLNLSKMSVRAKLTMMLLPALFGMMFFSLTGAYKKYQTTSDMNDLQKIIEVIVKTKAVIHETQVERGMSAGFLSTKGEKFLSELPAQRRVTDKKIAELNLVFNELEEDKTKSMKNAVGNALSELKKIDGVRSSINGLNFSSKESFAFYTGLIERMMEVVTVVAKNTSESQLTLGAVAYLNFAQTKERAGRERAIMNTVFTADHFEKENYRLYLAVLAEQAGYLEEFLATTTEDMHALYKEYQGSTQFREVEAIREIVLERAQNGKFGITPDHWFTTAT